MKKTICIILIAVAAVTGIVCLLRAFVVSAPMVWAGFMAAWRWLAAFIGCGISVLVLAYVMERIDECRVMDRIESQVVERDTCRNGAKRGWRFEGQPVPEDDEEEL